MNEAMKPKNTENKGLMRRATKWVAAPLVAGLLMAGCGLGMKNVETKTPKKGCSCLVGKVEFYKPIWFKVESVANESEQKGIELKAPASSPVVEDAFKPIPPKNHRLLSEIKKISKPFAPFEYRLDDTLVYKQMPPVKIKIRKPSDVKKMSKPFIPLE